MPLPSSGQIGSNAIRVELGVPSQTNFSITTAATGGYAAINTNSSFRPNNAQPHNYSEWYGYNHTAAPPSGFQNLFVTENNAGNTSYLLSAQSSGWIRSLTQATSFSISFWLFPKNIPAAPGYAFHIRNFNSSTFFDNNIAVRWNSSLGMSFFMSSQTSIARTHTISSIFTNVWSHYVITYNAATSTVISYRNGVATGTGTSFAGLNMSAGIDRNLAVGGLAGNAASSNGTQARVDELAFYNRVLSASEVTSIFASRQAFNHSNLGGLLGWWRFENNGNSTVGSLNLTNVNSQLFSSITMPF